MAKIKSKGTVFQVSVSSLLTAVAQLTDISFSGAEVETFDCTTLSTTDAGKEYSQTGYSEPGELSIGGFFDPSLHGTITSNITTPAEVDCAVVFADSTTWTFKSAGMSLDFTVAMSDGVKFTSTLTLTELPGW